MSVIYIKKCGGYKEFDHNCNELSITSQESEILSRYAVKEELADTKGG